MTTIIKGHLDLALLNDRLYIDALGLVALLRKSNAPEMRSLADSIERTMDEQRVAS